jgi:alpha/beta hydrolase family protein
VPGIFTTAPDDLGALVGDAADVGDAARTAGATSVATVAWLGYRTPQNLYRAAGRGDARSGGRALSGALAGLAAARAAQGAPDARTTLLAHSYGTVVADEAAHRPGRLAADAVVLLGSPGMERDGAAGLEAPEVYDAAGWADPVAALRWFGEGPWEPGYGATPLPTDRDTGHSDYYDPGHSTLAALGAVVAGTFRPR